MFITFIIIIFYDRIYRKKLNLELFLLYYIKKMTFTPQAYPLSFSSNAQRNTLEYSNQVILPPEMLAAQPNYTGSILFFTIANKEKKINVGVYEFTDIPDVCYIPYYFMMMLGIKEGDRVQIEQMVEEPQKATAITLKPQEQAFIELNDPKVILEYHMSRLYPILTLGDVIRIYYDDIVYCLSISKLEPAGVVQTIDCDISLDFEEAYDFKSIKPAIPERIPPHLPSNNEVYEGDSNYIVNDIQRTNVRNRPFVAFRGKGHRLGNR